MGRVGKVEEGGGVTNRTGPEGEREWDLEPGVGVGGEKNAQVPLGTFPELPG